jgi:DNA-binding transcriptional ArsR family regulator
MAYRVHFTAEDLSRTRVADAPLPLWELAVAMRALLGRAQPVRLDQWRRRVRARLDDSARMVLSLNPPVGYSPTFFLASTSGDLDEAMEEARATPRADVQAELSWIARRQRMPSWSRGLGDDPELLDRFHDGLTSLYTHMLKPYWDGISGLVVADRSARMRDILDGGVERLLSRANPLWLRWRPPVLEIRMPDGAEHDLRLHGQGVVLVPSVFATRSTIVTGIGPQPAITYPAGTDTPLDGLRVLRPGYAGISAVSALVGQTRSAVLSMIAEYPGCSTKELATLAGIAPASASEHATILRESGLINTLRHHNTALHSPTGLGLALLNGRSS